MYLPDTRGVTLSRYGRGNLKIGSTVYTYSRLPGRPYKAALGTVDSHAVVEGEDDTVVPSTHMAGTCPGSTPECEKICYAARPVAEMGPVATMWLYNSTRNDVPPIPGDAKLLRLHIGGDFDSLQYIWNWISELRKRPDVTCWVYTRSWRVPELLPALKWLRALPNVQMFASMDKSHTDVPPAGWRRAWIDGDPRAGDPQLVKAHCDDPVTHNLVTFDSRPTYVCPEETGRVKDCESCGYCFTRGATKDVTFLQH